MVTICFLYLRAPSNLQELDYPKIEMTLRSEADHAYRTILDALGRMKVHESQLTSGGRGGQGPAIREDAG